MKKKTQNKNKKQTTTATKPTKRRNNGTVELFCQKYIRMLRFKEQLPGKVSVCAPCVADAGGSSRALRRCCARQRYSSLPVHSSSRCVSIFRALEKDFLSKVILLNVQKGAHAHTFTGLQTGKNMMVRFSLLSVIG